jgi:hypothetical protein
MLRVLRPSLEVVKEGRILHFVSGDKRFEGILVFGLLFDLYLPLS